ncbi:MAG TPA: heavy metal-binding domain-containing protein [Solirubrobacteraceae bacterium]|jgi:uncharacterized protein YbjQ (UPF0145 family)
MAAGTAFTSDLSVSGFALCHQLGLKPIHQVMGSSIYQVGYQSSTWPMMMGGTVLTELDTLSQAWNEVRGNALGRLANEARELGAHAVVGVQLRIGSHDWAEGAIEYLVLGTAVHRAGAEPTGEPILTELSVSDYAKLVQAGMEPAGIAAWSSVFFASYTFNSMLAVGGGLGGLGGSSALGGASYNYELKEFTQAFYNARAQVMQSMGEQAQQMGAAGIVGVRIEHSARRHTIGGGRSLGGGGERNGLVVEFHAIGTAIKETAGAKPWPPEMTIDLTS